MMPKRKLLPGLVAVLALLAGCGGSAPLTPHQKSVHRAAISGGLATTTQTSYGGRTHSQAFLQGALNPPASLSPFPTASPQLSGYDAVTASAIPFKPQVAACYVNGHYANCTAVKARQPVHLVTIAVNTSGVARILDVEPGDASPSQAGGWVRSMIGRHIWRPGIYANASTMPAVEQSLRSAGLSRSSYVLWVAAWDGNPTVPGGFDAKQWRSVPALDWDSFLTSFFTAPQRTICWGKGSTPTSSTCRGVEKKANAAWQSYKQTEHTLGQRRTELKNVQSNITKLEANSIHISVKVNYIGPGAGWANAQIKTLTARAAQEKGTHDKLVKQYSG